MKKWENAEILELGIKSTKVEYYIKEEHEDNGHQCKYCGHVFTSNQDKKDHKANCIFKHPLS